MQARMQATQRIEHRAGATPGRPGAPAPGGDPAGTRREAAGGGLWGWAIALASAVWAMRTVGAYAIVQTDAARHAMNGVFIRDFLVRGNFTDALPFARAYYAHFPALSMPYHPPLFPFIEALFFFVFGVNAVSARLAVAVAVGLSAILLFRLVKKTEGATTVAAVSTISFLCLPQSLWLGSDVMLEFPTLVFMLLALRCLEPVDTEYPVGRALLFALLSGAAVWTKQQAVFLGIVPFLYFALRRQWVLFRKPALWISSAVFAGLVAGLSALSIPFEGTGVSQAIPAAPGALHLSYMRLFWRNLTFYAGHYYGVVGPAGLILIAAVAIACGLRLYGRRPVSLYASWVIASLAVPLLIRPYNTRYLFFTLPALIVLGYVALNRVALRLSGKPTVATAALLVVACISVSWKFPYRIFYLHGPDEAARWLAASRPKRILYCGETDGNFIFSYRSALDASSTSIITADKLPPGAFKPDAIERFAHEYGIQYVVVEDLPAGGANRPWTWMTQSPPPAMSLERKIPMTSSTGRWNGMLRVFRFSNPSAHPKDVLSMRMWMSGRTMDFRLE
jgi:4-amino-4-deoxy-L-arabinose transferase-like glycosyltransferase